MDLEHLAGNARVQGPDCAFGWAISQVVCAAGNLERLTLLPRQ